MSVVTVEPRDRAAWSAWLEAHHASAAEVIVIFYRKGGPGTSVSYPDAVEEALCFGWIDGVKKKVDEWRYSHRFTPRRPGSVWSALNRERVERLRAAGKLRPAGAAAVAEAQRTGSWDRGGWPAAIVMPAELTAALAKSKTAKKLFDALAPSHQKSWTSWVGAGKQAETRARRAAVAVQRLRDGIKHPSG